MNLASEDIVRSSLEKSFLAFVAIDILNFVFFLCALEVESIGSRRIFSESSELLNQNLGVLNTSILITSGWLVAMAVRAYEKNEKKSPAIFLSLAAVIGSGFGAVKFFEYNEKLVQGFTPQTNEFFAFYFVITGLHLIHWAIGLAFLCALATLAWRNIDSPVLRKWLPIGALFWHMVDVIWIIIFPCLYFQWAS